jgi:hypothetical protein
MQTGERKASTQVALTSLYRRTLEPRELIQDNKDPEMLRSSWDFFFIIFGADFMVSGFRNHTLNDVIFIFMDVSNKLSEMES